MRTWSGKLKRRCIGVNVVAEGAPGGQNHRLVIGGIVSRHRHDVRLDLIDEHLTTAAEKTMITQHDNVTPKREKVAARTLHAN